MVEALCLIPWGLISDHSPQTCQDPLLLPLKAIVCRDGGGLDRYLLATMSRAIPCGNHSLSPLIVSMGVDQQLSVGTTLGQLCFG